MPGEGTSKSSFTTKDTFTIIHGVDSNNNEIAYINHWTGFQ